MSPRLLRLLLALALVALAAAAPARAGTPAQDLAWLNAIRVANGIPGGITPVQSWSDACAQHLRYLRRTGTMSHAEDPANPNYTAAGNWAGTHAVLASGLRWTEANLIWEHAPLHLSQLLAPQLSQAGVADDGQYVCVTTWPGYLRRPPATNTIVTYPGNGTSTFQSEYTQEWPITPAQALGVGNPTGPHLYVYEWGPATADGVTPDGVPIGIRSATLTGPNGRVPVRWVDPLNPVVGRYLPLAMGIVIPTRTLASNQRYRATVTMTDGTAHAWAFTTMDNGEQLALRDVRFTPRRTARIRACLVRRGGRCLSRRLRYLTTIGIRGVYADQDFDTGGRASAVEVLLDGVGRGIFRTAGDGSFDSTFGLLKRNRRFSLLVQISAGDDIAAYMVRFRIDNRGGRPVAVVYSVRRVPPTAAALASLALRRARRLHLSAPAARTGWRHAAPVPRR